jgi:hypothetical protein
MSDSVDDWFNFVEDYYSKSSVPLSWVLIGGGEITGLRTPGSPLGMTTLSKREWNKVVRSNAPRTEPTRGVATTKGGKNE